MAQEIVSWCDLHLAESGEREPAGPVAFALDNKSRLVDLCEAHEKALREYLTPLIELGRSSDQVMTKPVKQIKQKLKTGPKSDAVHSRDEPVPCPIEGCTLSGTRETMRSHLPAGHGMSLTHAETHILGKGLHGETLRVPCSHHECDLRFSTAQGASAHYRSVHRSVR